MIGNVVGIYKYIHKQLFVCDYHSLHQEMTLFLLLLNLGWPCDML